MAKSFFLFGQTHSAQSMRLVFASLAIFLTILIPSVLFGQQKDVIRNRISMIGDSTKYYLTETFDIKKMDKYGELVDVGGIYTCTCPEFDGRVDINNETYFLLGSSIVTMDNKVVGSQTSYKNAVGITPCKDCGKKQEPTTQKPSTPKRRFSVDENMP